MPYIQLNSGRFHYRERGSGPLAVFVHGFPLDSTMWLDQLRGLSDVRRCVAIDLAGSGRSDPIADEALTMERHAGDVADLIESLGEVQADVIALSMGGYVALALWEYHHPLVRSLALVDTRAGADNDAGRAKRDVMAIKTLVQGRQQLGHDMVGALLGPEAKLQAKARLRSMIEATPYETIVASIEGMKQRPDRTAVLSTITVPTVVVVGEHDAVTPPAEAEAMATTINNAKLEVVRGAGHMSPIEQPAAVGAILGAHFAQVDTPDAG
ncbi:MAG: alpha/beta hydrolase [Acidimicrobiia bacterium]|nr:alpha/beta hydrolase [Acidimicrobiia bacterium]